ncbi:MAG: DsbC family protein [Burkholderiales bacterium]|nr:DsbC family protein [Burkholderiales bacterium]
MQSTIARVVACCVASLLASVSALAQEAAIRENLDKRMPDLPKIDEVTSAPIPGLYEVRIGTDIFYTDEQGNHLIQGNIIDTRTRTDLTRARIDKLTAVNFAALPLKDAVVWKQGTGARKLAVFADPNCGYCKSFEKDMVNVRDVTVYTFLYPILGGDSPQKSRDVWCAEDPATVWRAWMIEGKSPPLHMGQCDDSALQRVMVLGRKHRITGTPTLVFENGTRIPGALPASQIEKQLTAARAKS